MRPALRELLKFCHRCIGKTLSSGLCDKCMVKTVMITQMRREEELDENCGSEGGEDEMDLRERVKRYQWQDLFKNEQVIMYLISCLNLGQKMGSFSSWAPLTARSWYTL